MTNSRGEHSIPLLFVALCKNELSCRVCNLYNGGTSMYIYSHEPKAGQHQYGPWPTQTKAQRHVKLKTPHEPRQAQVRSPVVAAATGAVGPDSKFGPTDSLAWGESPV